MATGQSIIFCVGTDSESVMIFETDADRTLNDVYGGTPVNGGKIFVGWRISGTVYPGDTTTVDTLFNGDYITFNSFVATAVFEWASDTMLVSPDSLETVADSIRAKSGKTDALAFPDGFKSAVEGLPTTTVDGTAVTEDLALKRTSGDVRLADLPAAFYNGCAVASNSRIHILGGSLGTSGTGHYVYDGTSWASTKVIPFTFTGSNGCCCVPSGAGRGVHVISSSSHYAYEYSVSGNAALANTWTNVGTPPYSDTNVTVAVNDGYIHMLGGANHSTSHYRLRPGKGWTGVKAVPYACTGCRAVAYTDGKLHIFGADSSANNANRRHCVYDETANTWTNSGDIPPIACTNVSAVAVGSLIYMYGGGTSNSSRQARVVYDGSTWTRLPNMTVKHSNVGNAAVLYDGAVHLLGSDYSPTSGEGLAYSSMHLLPDMPYLTEQS